jgi:hypothetical protein
MIKKKYIRPIIAQVLLDNTITLQMDSSPINPPINKSGNKSTNEPFQNPFGDKPFS